MNTTRKRTHRPAPEYAPIPPAVAPACGACGAAFTAYRVVPAGGGAADVELSHRSDDGYDRHYQRLPAADPRVAALATAWRPSPTPATLAAAEDEVQAIHAQNRRLRDLLDAWRSQPAPADQREALAQGRWFAAAIADQLDHQPPPSPRRALRDADALVNEELANVGDPAADWLGWFDRLRAEVDRLDRPQGRPRRWARIAAIALSALAAGGEPGEGT